MPGLLGNIFSTIDTQKRKLTDLLGNPVESIQQIVGNVNDRARNLNELTAAAAQEKDLYGPKSQQLASLLAEAYNPIGLTVYHGSPAKFTKFDPTKIGSGEGAQAYGYGHYVAESPSVAKEYRTALSEPELFVKGRQIKTAAGSNMDTAKAWLQDSFEIGAKNPYADAIEKVSNSPLKDKQGVIDALKKLENRGVQMQKGGFEYEIDLPDEQIAKMLDWDKPMSEQPNAVKKALGFTTRTEDEIHDAANKLYEKYGPANSRTPAQNKAFYDEYNALNDELDRLPPKLSGADYYRGTDPGNYLHQVLREDNANKAMSEQLRQAGVPGIRYLDQGSRSNFMVQNTVKGKPYGEPVSFMTEKQAQDYAAEQIEKGFGTKIIPGTSNFVVFPGNEGLLTILKRNGGLLGP